ncbi:zinc transport system substrate-binding protein [Halolactibacillus halophilus]|uniref:Zinc transport system substrate-binding protein n=1 Tax=Halolactibacillus halophilus TaxID=306540 RepID=A0A1I5S0X4_9BACI|nr:metal-binding protein ZinT [Halolactibacillus halophilus]GEM02441.1 hypothetical protein HHA03_19730 [Halolactibacillus halophilus]SFP64438.1 zinc transport system substrate-binding protein [Halolactibacillus halophilus]
MKKNTVFTGFIVAVLLFLLVACQNNLEEEQETAADNLHDVPVQATIDGLANHYHTDDSIELIVRVDEINDYSHWHWYTRVAEEAWTESADSTNVFHAVAEINELEIKAILFDDEHQPYLQSDVVTVVIDDHEGDHDHAGHDHGDDDHADHNHAHDEETEAVYNGYFEDNDIEDRTLADWEGDWQSVYPYLLAGDLDPVFEKKAEDGEMSAADYQEYYTTGYETDVERITIEDDTFTFYTSDDEMSASYTYDDYEILTYEKGNRGVRYSFKRSSGDENMPQYIQFSDHAIRPQTAHHFHLYWGDNRDELLEEVTNWPTFYPAHLDSEGLVHDMLAH